MNSESAHKIREITDCFVSKVNPLKVILFGSFADGSYTDDSDYDFYLVVEDGRNIGQATDDAYNAVTYVKNRRLISWLELDLILKRKDNLLTR